jgi:chorismate mutase
VLRDAARSARQHRPDRPRDHRADGRARPYVAEAGRFKANPASVSAPARVEAIIAKVRTIARQNGLAESVAERSYRAMIAAFEDYERDEWMRRNGEGKQ